MNKNKVIIIEDEMVIATSISNKLIKLNYLPFPPCASYREAIELLENESPDIALIDIRIKGQKDGIDLALYIREHYSMPIIFITANSDPITLQKAKLAQPNAYLIKPFTQTDLYTTIEIAILNFELSQGIDTTIKKTILLKQGKAEIKIAINDIYYIESKGNYLNIISANSKQQTIRGTLNDLEKLLPKEFFHKISRSHIVNFIHASELETERIKVGNYYLKLNEIYRKEIIEKNLFHK